MRWWSPRIQDGLTCRDMHSLGACLVRMWTISMPYPPWSSRLGYSSVANCHSLAVLLAFLQHGLGAHEGCGVGLWVVEDLLQTLGQSSVSLRSIP